MKFNRMFGVKKRKKSLLLGLTIGLSISLFGCSGENAKQEESSSKSINSYDSEEQLASSEKIEVEESESSFDKEIKESGNEEETSEGNQPIVEVKKYSFEEASAKTSAFLEWAASRAEKGNMAVTDLFFNHGAAGKGDWYAVTEDGEIQVQQPFLDETLPGYDAFDIHALGGVVFYTSLSGITGYDGTPETQATAVGFHEIADLNYSMHKYLLGDNGVVYELIGTVEEIGSFSAGYDEYSDDGLTKPGAEAVEKFVFEVSEDKDAQKEWVRILTED
ncbi:hypothetical protein [Carnobacterium sp. FSL W8-0810]|uniref:hypothetical protein n=1 Tax=Carnobacterium sp. FSL W8-0810 TaxID=2954705 RepID=UPI0030F69264